MNALRAIATLMLALVLGTSGIAQTIVYDAFPGVDPGASVGNLESLDEVADWIQLAGTERQLAQIDIGMVAAPNTTASLRATLYKNDASGGPGTVIAISNPIAVTGGIGSPNPSIFTVSVFASDFPDPFVIMDDNLYVGVRFDNIFRASNFFPIGPRVATESGVDPGTNPTTETFYRSTAGGAWIEENGAQGFGLALTLHAIDVIPEPATVGLLLVGLAGLLGLRNARGRRA